MAPNRMTPAAFPLAATWTSAHSPIPHITGWRVTLMMPAGAFSPPPRSTPVGLVKLTPVARRMEATNMTARAPWRTPAPVSHRPTWGAPW